MAGPEQVPQRRQFVNFLFYKVDPAWRRLPEHERTQGKQEFIRVAEEYTGKIITIPYTTVGIRGDCDIMLWRITYELELFQEMSTKLLSTALGKYLSVPYSYLSMTKRSIYVDHHTHENQESKRLTIVPGKSKYIFVYGLDDQEWVVAFESDKPEDFLDLVMALRETEGSRYTLRDTPIFTCINKSLKEALDTLGG